MPKKLSNTDEQYIREHYLTMSSRQIGDALGHPRGTIMSFLRRENLKLPSDVSKAFKIAGINAAIDAKEHPEDEVIKSEYLKTNVNQLSIKVNRSETFVKTRLKRLGLIIPEDIIEQRKIDSLIKPGNVPINKGLKHTDYMDAEMIARTAATRFKKGNLPGNTLYDGAIRTRHDHPERNGGIITTYIRISLGKWQELQRYNWEQAHGKIKKGMVLACKDGNRLNCDASNWELITKAENMRRNTIHNLPEEIKEVILLQTQLTRKVKKIKKAKS